VFSFFFSGQTPIDRVRNEVLPTAKEERNIVHTIKRTKANWIGTQLAQALPSKTLY
jgi:hypothetical protein